MPLGEGGQVLLQPPVGGQVQHLVRHALADLLPGSRHGSLPRNSPGRPEGLAILPSRQPEIP